MTLFEVSKPFVIPILNGQKVRMINTSKIKDFWNNCSDLKNKIGCYIYFSKASRGYKPIYVGKTTKSFGQEIYTADKLLKLNSFLSKSFKGTLQIQFVCIEKTANKIYLHSIKKLEIYLIQTCLAKNFNLLNIHHTKEDSWSISGLYNSKAGKPSNETALLKKIIK